MQPLDKTLRNRLERTVKDARDIAEAAARAVLEHLGVGNTTPFSHLSETERELRRKLRVHGRQLGDSLNGGKIQTMDRLIEEVAYEHWHRMLFARFLAENNLLMYPDQDEPIAVTLEECKDLAADEGAKSGWELASRFAERMLPQIFRSDSPVFQLEFPPEYQQKLELLLAEQPQEVFHSSDSIGWVYQFWQSKKKDEVNASEVKIGARELSAVTQLFTEPYMVAFLLDNSLGAWWVSKLSGARNSFSEELKPGAIQKLRTAKSEQELREFFALPGVPLDYLRFVEIPSEDDKTGGWKLETEHAICWRPASGWFDGWPEDFEDLKILDPCCGSGHFLVAAFLMLIPMRVELEGLSMQEAVDRILNVNIHGLELDPRCVELAVFALALSAWRLTGYRPLPAFQVACTGLSVGGTREQWMDILAGQTVVTNLRFYFGQLYDLFSKAPTLGSLINPHRFLGSGLLNEKGMVELHRALSSAMAQESKSVTERSEMGVTAQGVAKASQLLSDHYTLVVTNVPYLGRGKQDDVLKKHLEIHYPLGKADLATAFVLRCLEFCAKGGTTALVTPQSWLFLTTYTKLRQLLLENRTWNGVARLGSGAFETISGQVVNVALLLLSTTPPAAGHVMAGIDISMVKDIEEKAAMLRGEKIEEILIVNQVEQLKNPDARVTFSEVSTVSRLSAYATALQGIKTGDDAVYVRRFWEIERPGASWLKMQSTVESTVEFGGTSLVLNWSDSGEGIARLQGRAAWSKPGVAISLMSDIRAALFVGDAFDSNVSVITPKTLPHLPAIWSYCSSQNFSSNVKAIEPGIKANNGALLKIGFDFPNWLKIAAEKYPNGLPEPESNDPTQWLFHGRPEHSTVPLQVAVARLLGYRWPAELDEKMHLSERARTLVKRCDELWSFVDTDGIVCVPSVRGEASAADRLLNLLATAYGNDWSTDILSSLLNDVGFAGKSLEVWLRDGFFSQHCDLFHQRPFIWQIWDGLRDGFSAMVNYHTFDRKTLETLIFTYLGDWIKRQKEELTSGIEGAEERLDAAEVLKRRLDLILNGEAPYDIFVRWKPVGEQPIGWEPDLNDGVRLNIRPFMSPFINVSDVKKTKGSAVLRIKPKIKWDKDRGKEAKRPIQKYPWFWGWDGTDDFKGGPVFTGERFNDCHYTLDFKRRARQQQGDKEGDFS